MTDDYKELIVGQTNLQAEMKYLTEDIRELVKCVKSLELREPGHKEIEHRLRRLELRENALRKDLEIYLFISIGGFGLYFFIKVLDLLINKNKVENEDFSSNEYEVETV